MQRGSRSRGLPTRRFFRQPAVLEAIPKVDDDSDDGPDSEPDPSQLRKLPHESKTGHRSKDRHDRHKRQAKWPGMVRFGIAQDDYADTDKHEGKESADIRHVGSFADGNERSQRRDGDTGKNRRAMRCAESWVNRCEPGSEQPI